MGFILGFWFLFLIGLCSVCVCCGALVLLVRVPLLVSRQRATLWGVGR